VQAEASLTIVAQECQSTSILHLYKRLSNLIDRHFQDDSTTTSHRVASFFEHDIPAPRKAFLEGRQLLIISQIQLPLAAAICVEIQAGFSHFNALMANLRVIQQ